MNQDRLIRNLKLQLMVERTIIALVLLLFLGRYAAGHFLAAPYSIEVEGKPVAFVKSRQSAEAVIGKMKKGPGAQFKEDVTVGRRAPKDSVVAEAAAIKALDRATTLMVEAWVIFIDGKPGAALPSEEKASQVLNRAREHYGSMVQNLMELPTFKEDVKVEPTLVESDLMQEDIAAALDRLISGTPRVDGAKGLREHVVQQGQLAGQIAQTYGINLDQLIKLNRDRNLNRLQIGDRLIVGKRQPRTVVGSGTTVAGERPRLTVVVRDSITRVEPIPHNTETISSMQLYEGKGLLLSPGRPGSRRVKRAVTYENGVKTGSEIVEETILSQPVPKRIAVGIKRR